MLEKLYLTQPLFRRFLALVWTAARCDLVVFFHLFDAFKPRHFSRGPVQEVGVAHPRTLRTGQGPCVTTSWAFQPANPTLASLPRVTSPSPEVLKGTRRGQVGDGKNEIKVHLGPHEAEWLRCNRSGHVFLPLVRGKFPGSIESQVRKANQARYSLRQSAALRHERRRLLPSFRNSLRRAILRAIVHAA